MGYRSDIVIAVNKEVLARNLIQKEIPECLGEPEHVTDKAAYWFIEGWKWYSSYHDVQEINAWFDELAHEEFGAMRIGEDDDTETWGEPYEFDIYLNRSIVYPGSD